MILTADRKTKSTGFVENSPASAKHLPDATRKRILNSTVKLFASAADPKDKDSPNVNASGVIFSVEGNNVKILTAAHNILMWKKLSVPPKDWSDVLTDFAAKLTVYYGNGDLTFNSEVLTNKCKKSQNKDPITVTIPVVPGVADCASTMKSPSMYDLALITCADATFATYVKNSVLGANFRFQEQVAGLIDGATATLQKKYACIQLGYGVLKETRTRLSYNAKSKTLVAVTDNKPNPISKESDQSTGMKDYHLHYRVTALKANAATCMFNLEAEAGQAPSYSSYSDAFELSAIEGTSAPGDSGGPVYIVDTTDMTKVYLLGVTTGSDMEASETPPTGVFTNDISTSVLPYFQTLKPPPPKPT
jgi:hypothetical protein